MAKSRELNFKLKKVHGKIETTTVGFGASLSDSLEQIRKSSQAVKGLANEQTRVVSELTLDFQQQTGQLSRTFHSAVSDVEGSFRAAISLISSLRQSPLLAPSQPAPVYPTPNYPPHSALPKRVPHRVEPEIREEPNRVDPGFDGNMQKWRREARRSRADRARIKQEFRQLKQKIPDD
jgi:hypothetical protein